MAEELLQRRVAAQGWNAAHHDEFVLGSGDSHIKTSPVLQEGTKLFNKHNLLLFFLFKFQNFMYIVDKTLIFKTHLK